PAVLTETLYMLHKQDDWPVKEIKIITTSHGADVINEALFSYGTKEKGGFYQLCEELKISPHDIDVQTGDNLVGVTGPDGKPLSDIRNSEDDERMATAIQHAVKQACANPERRVFGLLSGGRKTMSAHLMAAMQLFGRLHDRLIHVLVSEPFESIPDFFFPTSEKRLLNSPYSNHYADASKATIDLIDIPFIRLRSYLEHQINFSKSYLEITAEIDEKLSTAGSYPVQHLLIDLPDSSICVNGLSNRIAIEARPLSVFTLFAVLNRLHGKPREIAWGEVIQSYEYLSLLHLIYRTIKMGPQPSNPSEYQALNLKEFRNEDLWSHWSYWRDHEGRPCKNDFSTKRSQLLAAIRDGLHSLSLQVSSEHLLQINNTPNALATLHKVPV
ncbi:MAG: CRISPR-associated ring nuclease Csm6, partial [Candidatus Paceibacterota bacterium]